MVSQCLNICLSYHTYLFEHFSDTQSLLDPLVDWVTELTNISANARYVILENLKAANTYQFRISAMNAIGEGTPSQPSNFVTLPQQGLIKLFI